MSNVLAKLTVDEGVLPAPQSPIIFETWTAKCCVHHACGLSTSLLPNVFTCPACDKVWAMCVRIDGLRAWRLVTE